MNDLLEASPSYLGMLATTESNTAKLLPLLSLLEVQESPDRIGQLMELLRLIVNMQQQQAVALKSVIDKLDRVSRR